MDLNDLIQNFTTLSGHLSIEAATAQLGKADYGVVVERGKPIGIATPEKLNEIARTSVISLAQAARALPDIIYTGLDFGPASNNRRIATVVMTVPMLEPELRKRAEATSLIDIGTRGGLLLDASGGGVLPFEDIVEYLQQHRQKTTYGAILTNLVASRLIGESGSAQTLGGSGAGLTAQSGVRCETCGYLNMLNVVPSCNERPKKCQNPDWPPHPLKVPGC